MPIAKIDSSLCNGCGKCVDTCPEDVFRLNVDPIDAELLSPCAEGCPAGMSVRKYSYYIEMDMLDEAIEAIREYIPFPAVTGRICPHFCESKCARNELEGAVNINCLERFVADRFIDEKAAPVKAIYLEKAAVIGSGPAGLSCAYYLCRKGYKVTVFEKHDVLGGMLRLGIPDFHLPRDVVDKQIQYLRDMGVQFRTGVELGRDVSFDEIMSEYGAAFIAIGTQVSRVASIEGDRDVEGLFGAFDFLRSVHLGEAVSVGKKVAVIGGGNVAMDAAMTLARKGAEEVSVISLEGWGKMPAFDKEIKAAQADGVNIFAGYGSKRILGENGKVTGLEFVACTQVTDKAGRFAPVFDESESRTIEVDQIYFAVGQSVDSSGIPAGIERTPAGTIKADPLTLETNVPGVFAGGDAVRPQDGAVVRSFAAGKKAAESIDRYLRGVDMREGRNNTVRVMHPPKDGIYPIPRRELEPGQVFTETEARLEAQRCMTCGSRSEIVYPEDCMVCLYCERDCPQRAITVTPDRPGKRIAPWDLA